MTSGDLSLSSRDEAFTTMAGHAFAAAAINHAAARGALNLKTFRGSAAGGISEFPNLLRYLSGAQGSSGGVGNAGFLATVQSQISALQRESKSATPEQQKKIADEIVVLQTILRQKRFEPSLDLLKVLQGGQTDTLKGKALDDAILPLTSKVATAADQRETNRLLGQQLLNKPVANVTVNVLPQPIKFVLNGRDIVNGVILSNSFRRATLAGPGIS
jgi:hypothetical protein